VGVFAALFKAITVLVMTFFFLLDGRRMLDFCFRQLGPERERRAQAIASDMYRAVSGYVTGALIIAGIAGLSTYLMMNILGIPFAIPLSVLMSFLVLIPLVGATIGGLIIAAVAAADDFPTALAIWTAFFVLYQQLENNVLQPFVYKRTIALHPLLVIIAVLVGASQRGVLGALVAIPVAAAVQIGVQDLWRYRKRDQQHELTGADGPEPDPEPA
jgi:predicted PurR-regulated permease PerM